MAASAYILVNIDPTKTTKVVKRLETVSGAIVREVMGPYDAVIELERDTVEDLTSAIASKIRSIPGGTATVTCLWIEHPSTYRHAGGE